MVVKKIRVRPNKVVERNSAPSPTHMTRQRSERGSINLSDLLEFVVINVITICSNEKRQEEHGTMFHVEASSSRRSNGSIACPNAYKAHTSIDMDPFSSSSCRENLKAGMIKHFPHKHPSPWLRASIQITRPTCPMPGVNFCSQISRIGQ